MKATLFLLVLLFTPGARAAGFREGYRIGRWDISFDPGLAIPLGATYDQMSNSGNLQFSGSYQYNEYWSFGAELGWQFNHRWGGQTNGEFAQDFNRDGLLDRVPYSSNIHEKILELGPIVKFGRWFDVVSYKVRPYFILGAGLYHTWTNSGTTVTLGRDQISGRQVGPFIRQYDTSSNSYIGFNGGGGVELQIDENAALGLGLRYSRIDVPFEDLEFLTPSFKIMYLF